MDFNTITHRFGMFYDFFTLVLAALFTGAIATSLYRLWVNRKQINDWQKDPEQLHQRLVRGNITQETHDRLLAKISKS